jgi:hypothetical protein
MNTIKKSITCFCENTFEAVIPQSVDLSQETHVVSQVLSGDFMSVSCPLCGKRLTPEYPCAFLGLKEGRDLYFIPEMDRAAYTRGKLPYDIGKPWRVAIGYAELAEKIRMITQGLDDRVVEIMKFLLLSRSTETPSVPGSAQEGDGEIEVEFSGQSGDALEFHIKGLRKGEVAVARLKRDLYAKIEADVEKRVKEEPYKEFCVPPYVSLRQLS